MKGYVDDSSMIFIMVALVSGTITGAVIFAPFITVDCTVIYDQEEVVDSLEEDLTQCKERVDLLEEVKGVNTSGSVFLAVVLGMIIGGLFVGVTLLNSLQLKDDKIRELETKLLQEKRRRRHENKN